MHFPATSKCFYVINEELFLAVQPVIYGLNEFHRSQMSVHGASLSTIGTHGSEMEPDLENTAGDLSVRSRSLQ